MRKTKTKAKKIFFKRFITLSILLCIFLVIIPTKKFLCSKITKQENKTASSLATKQYKENNIDTNNKNSSENTSSKKNTTKDNTEEKSISSIMSKNERNKNFFSNSIFFGDSITESISFYQVLDEKNVVAKKGLTVFKAKNEVVKVIQLNPKNIFILLGNNDLFDPKLKSDQFINGYSKLITKFKDGLPNCKIYILSILPVTKKAVGENPFLNFDRITKFNIALKYMANNQHLSYINIIPVLKNGEEFFEPDGIHPKCSFYNELLNYLKNYLSNLQN